MKKLLATAMLLSVLFAVVPRQGPPPPPPPPRPDSFPGVRAIPRERLTVGAARRRRGDRRPKVSAEFGAEQMRGFKRDEAATAEAKRLGWITDERSFLSQPKMIAGECDTPQPHWIL